MQKNKIQAGITCALAAIILFQAAWIIRLKNPALKKSAAAKAAIVLDDWGYNTQNLQEAVSIGRPITLAILPNLPYSRHIATYAAKRRLETILHLPLEARSPRNRPEKDTITTAMPARQAAGILRKNLTGLPGVKGVSNHMGSKATEDERLMDELFARMRRKNLFFLDSVVTQKSVCRKTAKKRRIRFAERDIFLDNENDLNYIKGQLRRLISAAKAKKKAIGIGHDRRLTLIAIKQMLAEFDREGVKLVYLSEMVK